MNADPTMSADQSATLPFLRARSPLKLLRASLWQARHRRLRPALRARSRELQSELAGRLTFYTNVSDFAHVAARPLVLLHGVHTSGSAFELNGVFESLRDERPIYALDLPGFGCSERGEREYGPEVYESAIRELLELATRDAAPADVIAVGLTSEYVARVAVVAPELVHSLILVSPTGFAVKREQDSFERASRRGKSVLPMRIASSLGLSPLVYRALVTERSLRYLLRRAASNDSSQRDDYVRYCHAAAHQPGAHHAALAYLSGALHPVGNPQSVYTRVHRPTLILFADESKPRYGSLETFVKWHEFFAAERVADTDLANPRSAELLLPKLHSFWESVASNEQDDEQSGVFDMRCGRDTNDIAALSSY